MLRRLQYIATKASKARRNSVQFLNEIKTLSAGLPLLFTRSFSNSGDGTVLAQWLHVLRDAKIENDKGGKANV
jgi:hypothetical protein